MAGGGISVLSCLFGCFSFNFKITSRVGVRSVSDGVRVLTAPDILPVANFETLEFLRILNTRKIVVDWKQTDLVGMENF